MKEEEKHQKVMDTNIQTFRIGNYTASSISMIISDVRIENDRPMSNALSARGY